MPIRIATSTDIAGWVELRAQLWSECASDQHHNEIVSMLAKPPSEFIAFIDVRPEAGIRAFAEATLRKDYVNGCETSPVAFLEGIFVKPEYRGFGIGRDLVRSVLSWAQKQGCRELASDALLDNNANHEFHNALGFEETERVVYFRRLI